MWTVSGTAGPRWWGMDAQSPGPACSTSGGREPGPGGRAPVLPTVQRPHCHRGAGLGGSLSVRLPAWPLLPSGRGWGEGMLCPVRAPSLAVSFSVWRSWQPQRIPQVSSPCVCVLYGVCSVQGLTGRVPEDVLAGMGLPSRGSRPGSEMARNLLESSPTHSLSPPPLVKHSHVINGTKQSTQ